MKKLLVVFLEILVKFRVLLGELSQVLGMRLGILDIINLIEVIVVFLCLFFLVFAFHTFTESTA